jgi:dsDNA-binding SOS-regulon protein
MQVCLEEHIGRDIEVYIDDIVVKTRDAATLIDDPRETFDNIDRYKIKLNPKKCVFGVPGDQVLRYFISSRGIEANPLKIKVVLDMEPPRSLQQVLQLAGRVAALSRFIAKLGEKALPFYHLMKKSENFEWTSEAQDAFDNLKKVISTSPVLVTPHDREPMLLYIAATSQVVSTVLVVEREEA